MLPKHNLRWIVLLVFLFLLSGCTNKKEASYRFITTDSDVKMHNWSKHMLSCAFLPDSGKMVTMPVMDGDLMYFNDDHSLEFYLRYTPDLPDTFRITVKDTLFFVNDKLVGLTIDASRDMLPWFKQMHESDIKSLRSIVIDSCLPDSYLPYLDKIAKANPAIDLFVENDNDICYIKDLNWLSEHFTPTILSVSLVSKDFSVLHQFTTVKTLLLSLGDSVQNESLPKLPLCKELILSMSDSEHIFTPNFLHQNPQIKALSVWGGFDPAQFDWKPLQQLQSLRLYNYVSFRPYPYGETFPSLKTLQLSGNANLQAHHFAGLQHLKELGLPASLPQEEFNQIIMNQPSLELLQIIGSDTNLIKDYSILQQEKQLKYLIISGEKTNLQSLYPLKGLKYLSLPDADIKDSVKLAAIKNALPDTVITPNRGFCMGSGWLIFLLPIVAVIFYCKKYLLKQ